MLLGATGGYLVGFIVTAALVGRLAELGADRRPPIAFMAFVGDQLSIFAIGVPWLKMATDMSWTDAIHNGFTIFIAGGIVKAVLAAGLMPVSWRLLRRLA